MGEKEFNFKDVIGYFMNLSGNEKVSALGEIADIVYNSLDSRLEESKEQLKCDTLNIERFVDIMPRYNKSQPIAKHPDSFR